MSFAKSGGSNIWSKKRWQKRMENREEPCRHVGLMRPDGGLMVCMKCGYQRMPLEGEDAGDPPMVAQARAQQQGVTFEDVDAIRPRMEGTGTDF